MRTELWESARIRRDTLRSIAALLLLGGVALVIALHALRPDVHPAKHYVSEYGNETWSWLMTSAGVLIGLGLLALAVGLRDVGRGRVGPAMIQGSGLLMILAALFSTDRQGGEVIARTLAGRLHGWTTIAAFCLLVLAIVALSSHVRDGRDPLGRLHDLALPAVVGAVALAAATFLVVPEAHGLRQRAFLAVVFGWLLAAAFQLRWLDPSEKGAEPATSWPEMAPRA